MGAKVFLMDRTELNTSSASCSRASAWFIVVTVLNNLRYGETPSRVGFAAADGDGHHGGSS